ncbi:MAG: M1 family metallopeptidase [Bacteroidia bacterium]
MKRILSHFRRNRSRSLLAAIALVAGLTACDKDNVKKSNPNESMDAANIFNSLDPHSYARPSEAMAKHLDLDIEVDFEAKRIRGTATYTVDRKGGGNAIIFDTRNLDIIDVTTPTGDSLSYNLGENDPVMGQPLEVELKPDVQEIRIQYATTEGAAALQWLSPQQTEGKQHPFLFTQSQAILARTWIPCQDGPGMRFTYNAKVKVPSNLMAVMSASNATERSADGVYKFEMNQPIPAYLMALAVGDLRFKSIGPRTGVYAEPTMIDRAANEFVDMEKMLVAAEELYGAYAWERYDVIVLPPSFPFGGMENPRLTFATPTIIAGDRSLTALVAHELAHSWSGNLVTNATWNDFWLNEGFTVYFESRIMERLYGKSYSDMLAVLGYEDLLETIQDLGADNPDTKLKLRLNGRDPDDGMTDIAYEKGNALLRTIEKAVGRERWDAFLKQYFKAHAFGTMTTEAFIEEAKRDLIKGDADLAAKIELDRWIYEPGLPSTYDPPKSQRFDAVDAQLKAWVGGTPTSSLAGTKEWSTHEWLRFIRQLPEDMSVAKMGELDKAFGFTSSHNSEILGAWFEHVIRRKYTAGYSALENFLVHVGRRKFVRPLFKAMVSTEGQLEMAKRIYAKARPNYHSVTQNTIDEMLK